LFSAHSNALVLGNLGNFFMLASPRM
jgi:hypothetical protein